MAGSFTQRICGGLILTLGLAVANRVQAELTVNDLTGTAVTEVGPYFADVNQAIRLFGLGDYGGALRHLEEAKKATPLLPPAEVMLAKLYFSAGQIPPACAMLERAMQVAPNDPEPPLLLIERALMENRLTEAGLLMPQAEKLLAGFSDNPRRKQDLQGRVYLTGAAIDQSRQRPDGAQAKLEALVKLDTSNAPAHQQLGQLYFEKGDASSQKLAWEEFKRAASIDPAALPADLMMAMLSKDPARAATWVEFAIKNSPNDPRTQVGAANHFLKEGQLDKAQLHAAQAIKLDEKGFESNLLAGITAQIAGEYAKAAEFFSRAHLLQPTNASVTNQLVLALLEMPGAENQMRALTFAELNVRMHPENLDVLTTLGWVNYRLKRIAEAERAFKTVLGARSAGGRLNINNDSTFILASVSADQNRRDDAARILQSILERKQLFAYRPQAEKLLAAIGKPAAATATPANPQPKPAASP